MDTSVVHPCHLISLPLVIVNGGEVLEAVFYDDSSAHGSCLYDCKGIPTLADFLEPRCQQAGIQSLLPIFGDGRPGEQSCEMTAWKIRPCDGCRLVFYIGSVHTQIAGDLKMRAEPLIYPGMMPAPNSIEHVNHILESLKIVYASD